MSDFAFSPYSNPDADQYDPARSGPAYSKGSKGALDEQMKYNDTVNRMNDPSENRGQGPTVRRARNG